MHIEDFKERLEFCCDPETFVEVLGLTMSDLMEAFEDRMVDRASEFDDLFYITEEFSND